jgi:hypothetical protein
MLQPMRRRALSIMTACLLVAFFLLIYPLYVIRPFRYQGPHELAAALQILRYRPYVEVMCAGLTIFLLLSAWRRSGLGRKMGLALMSLLVLAFGLLCPVNVYEKMFHPLDNPTFSAAAASKLDSGEQVIAVVLQNSARAYPIRIMSYHHIVNDTLGGRAIVATY